MKGENDYEDMWKMQREKQGYQQCLVVQTAEETGEAEALCVSGH
jgi:hypothetical protein